MLEEITEFRGTYLFLSNFYEHSFEFNGLVWPSSEHAYQACKTEDPKWIEFIRTLPKPAQAKSAGGRIKAIDNWDNLRVPMMRKVLEAKFSDERLEKLLIETGTARLVEGNWWKDYFWGVCNGKGENNLGKLLMEIRDGKIAKS